MALIQEWCYPWSKWAIDGAKVSSAKLLICVPRDNSQNRTIYKMTECFLAQVEASGFAEVRCLLKKNSMKRGRNSPKKMLEKTAHVDANILFTNGLKLSCCWLPCIQSHVQQKNTHFCSSLLCPPPSWAGRKVCCKSLMLWKSRSNFCCCHIECLTVSPILTWAGADRLASLRYILTHVVGGSSLAWGKGTNAPVPW